MRGLTQFLTSEHGGAGAWGLTFMLSVIVLAGLSIDGSNGIRAKEQLQTTADVAAHAGVVALAKGENAANIRTAVASATGWNLPSETYGDVLGDPTENVKLGVFQDGSFAKANVPDQDTVLVTLSMSKSRGNPVRAFLLNFIGRDSWDVVATSLATYQRTELCNSSDGIFARGLVSLNASASFGPDYCIFSKQGVELSGRNGFQSGSHVAMPDLSDCLKCDNAHNPGIEDAKRELNLQLSKVRNHNAATMDSMLGLTSYDSLRNDFLSSAALDADLTPLDDLGYNTNIIDKGDVVQISAADFETMDFVPTGLVYAVYCKAPLSAFNALVPTSAPVDANDGSGGNTTTLSFETTSGIGISDVAVVTDCLLDFGATASVQNSIIATEAVDNQSVSAASGARLGLPSTSCSGANRVVVITQGDTRIPAGLEINNVDFLVAGDLELSPGVSTQSTKRGTSFYVGGDADIAAQGNWLACGDGEDKLNASLKVIRNVVPSAPVTVAPIQ